ncbi:hypothetical protein DS745_04230 [Anaerobacillus alkaliphilus]|uniref:Uncharacterized protein n=1 Tax=Anaerobacillus alkaliphilus TaxID=1548597 RepID=A0A4Q0W077_9BACI|nr:hypothetical protein [Anaerobacillus alkaliphilus]RXJ04598.1 hypothetical protein DS745_04230 [Anaerobacillus alkaliphilus]
MKKLILGIVIFFMLVSGIIGLRFGSALFQEENTTEILAAIFKLESTDHPYKQVSVNSESIMFVSKNNNGSQVIKEFMEVRGWVFQEQMGSGYFFEKDEVTVVVETRLFTGNYFLWKVPREF